MAGLDDEELEVAVARLEEFFAVPVALELRFRTARQVAIWSASSFGNATACKLVSATAQILTDKIGILE